MWELESRLLRLLKLVKSITIQENEKYCAEEIVNILQQVKSAESDFSVDDNNKKQYNVDSDSSTTSKTVESRLYHHVLKSLLIAVRSERFESQQCAKSILVKLMPYLSKRIFLELLQQKNSWHDYESQSAVLLFKLSQIKKLKVHDKLQASDGDEFVHIYDVNEDKSHYIARQRKALLERIGLDLKTTEARKSQYRQDDPTKKMITLNDVKVQVQIDNNSNNNNNNNIQKDPKGISARQKNVLKRKANTEYQKKLLKHRRYGGLATIDKNVHINTLFLYQELSYALLDPSWHCRRGAALCLPHVVDAILNARKLLEDYSNNNTNKTNSNFLMTIAQFHKLSNLMLQDTIVRLLSVMSLERFADFASDIIVSPVQEEVSLSMSNIIMHLNEIENDFIIVLKHLRVTLLTNEDWQARYGAALSINYIIKNKKHKKWNKEILSACINGMNDVSDDVRAVLSEAVMNITMDSLSSNNMKEKSLTSSNHILTQPECQQLLHLMFLSLKKADDFSVSPSAILGCVEQLLLHAKQYDRKIWVSYHPQLLKLSSYLMHGITDVRIKALQLFQTHLLDVFIHLKNNYNIFDNNTTEMNFHPTFNNSTYMTLFVEMLILDADNSTIPIQKLKMFIYKLIEIIPMKYLLTACPISNWLQLASTANGLAFKTDLIMSANVLKSFNNKTTKFEPHLLGKKTVLNNNSIRLEKLSTPSTRVILTDIIGKVLTACKSLRADMDVAKLLLDNLSSDNGYQVIAAAQAIYATVDKKNNQIFVQHVQKQLIQCTRKLKRYSENESLQQRILYECKQLQEMCFDKIYVREHKRRKKGVKRDGQNNNTNDGLFEYGPFLKKLYKVSNTRAGHQIINELSKHWENQIKCYNDKNNRFDLFSLNNNSHDSISFDGVENSGKNNKNSNGEEYNENPFKIALNRIHGEFDIYQKSHYIIDIEVKVSLCGAILRCVDLENTAMPKNLNPIILPLLRGCKTVQNVELQTLIASSVVLLLQNVSRGTAGKILNNICLYIARSPTNDTNSIAKNVEDNNNNKNNNNENIERKGGICILKEASDKYKGLEHPLFQTIWSTINGNIVEPLSDTAFKGLRLLDSILDIPNINFQKCLNVNDTFLRLLNHHCVDNTINLAVNIIAKFACIDNFNFFHKIVMHVLKKNSTDVIYKLKMFHVLEAIRKMVIPSRIIPYILLIAPSIVHGISHFDENLRAITTKLFSWLLPYLAIEVSMENPNEFSIDMVNVRRRNSKLLSFLFVHERKVEYHPYVAKMLLNRQDRDDKEDTATIGINNNIEALSLTYRPYQLRGISWLLYLRDLGLHGLLCDDMGLGKTIQALTVVAARSEGGVFNMEHLNVASVQCPTLVLCPSSVLMHWNNEIKTYFPNKLIPVPFENGWTKKVRKQIKKEKNNSKAVFLMSYGLFRSRYVSLNSIISHWYYVILDEGHIISNIKSKGYVATKSLKAQHRLILSGTPIQNSAMELFPLFEFLMPDFLGKVEDYRRDVLKPIEAVQPSASVGSKHLYISHAQREQYVMALEKVHKKILPFFKRRTKSEVLKDLPPKIIQDRICQMPAWQKNIYKNMENKNEVSDNITMQLHLRMICTHPLLLNDAVRDSLNIRIDIDIKDEEDDDDEDDDENDNGKILLENDYDNKNQLEEHNCDEDNSSDNKIDCGKIQGLKQVFAECGIRNTAKMVSSNITNDYDDYDIIHVNTGNSRISHRFIIFVQFKNTLNFLEKYFCEKYFSNLKYIRLDSDVSIGERQNMIDEFNNNEEYAFLLTTTKVGGIGINLVGADTVIFFEHDWNPQMDLQAMDRVHRIGQTRVTNVIRLLCKDTIEERVMTLQRFKLNIANKIVGASEEGGSSASFPST